MNATHPKLRTKKCAVKTCRKPFTPMSMTHKACSPECAIQVATAARGKKEAQERRLQARREADDRKTVKAKKEALKTRQQWLKEAQVAFNAYIRERDAKEACISCGSFDRTSWDAGHLRSVGAAPQLRFHEDNVHKQCVLCNQHRSGNVLSYRINLCAKLGSERVEALEQSNEVVRYSIEDAKRIRDTYRVKLKELKKERE